MAYRNVMITTPCRISCQREQLVIQGETNVSFPLEDLLSLLIESRQCTVTTAALSALAKMGQSFFYAMKSIFLAPLLFRWRSIADSWR